MIVMSIVVKSISFAHAVPLIEISTKKGCSTQREPENTARMPPDEINWAKLAQYNLSPREEFEIAKGKDIKEICMNAPASRRRNAAWDWARKSMTCAK